MAIAGLINLSMLVMAAATFGESGLPDVDSLEGAHDTLEPLLGPAASDVLRDRAARLGPLVVGGRHARRARS